MALNPVEEALFLTIRRLLLCAHPFAWQSDVGQRCNECGGVCLNGQWFRPHIVNELERACELVKASKPPRADCSVCGCAQFSHEVAEPEKWAAGCIPPCITAGCKCSGYAP